MKPKSYRQWAMVLFFAMIAAATARASETTTYSYDPLGRLSGVTSTSGPEVNTSYDPAGNRTAYTVTGVGSVISFSIASATATEGGPVILTVNKSGAAAGPVSVSFATVNGSAVAGSDYTAGSGVLTFLPSETSKTIVVPTMDDSQVESAETFTVELSSPTGGALLELDNGTGTIEDNVAPPPSFAISNAPAITEGGLLQFTVVKTGPASSSFSVNYATGGGTATAGSDYAAASGTLTFAPAETMKTFNVATVDDSLIEPSETVLANLLGPTGGATVTTAQGSGTVNDNDVPPPNQPPAPVNDVGSQLMCSVKSYNVVFNDTDPDRDYPLTLVSVTGAGFAVASATNIQLSSGTTSGTRVGTYTVRDSRGATATATLTVTVSPVCSAR